MVPNSVAGPLSSICWPMSSLWLSPCFLNSWNSFSLGLQGYSFFGVILLLIIFFVLGFFGGLPPKCWSDLDLQLCTSSLFYLSYVLFVLILFCGFKCLNTDDSKNVHLNSSLSSQLCFIQLPLGYLISISNFIWPKQNHWFLQVVSSMVPNPFILLFQLGMLDFSRCLSFTIHIQILGNFAFSFSICPKP